jgi:hypothetical protein
MPTRPSSRNDLRGILQEYSFSVGEVGLTLFVFGLLIWAYVITIQIIHPTWLSYTLARYDVPPFNWRLDDVGVTSFALSAFGFFVWRIEARRLRNVV